MKKFAPMLLISNAAAEDKPTANELLTNLLHDNKNKYLNLLGLDEFQAHSNTASNDM